MATVVDWKRDLCCLRAHKSVVWKNKIYSVGGNSFISRSNSSITTSMANSYMITLDFTQSLDLNNLPETFETLSRLPDHIPILKGHSLIVANSHLRMFGGMYTIFPVFEADGITPSTSTAGRGNITDRVWRYDLEQGLWDEGYEQLGLGQETPNYTLDAPVQPEGTDTRTLWMYGGKVDGAGYYTVGAGGNWTLTPRFGPAYMLQHLLQYDISAGKFNEIPGRWPGDRNLGTMVHIPGIGEQGALVVIGGQGQPTLDRVLIFDIAGGNWYSQPTSSNIIPRGRTDACAVAASAEDGSSHNIYLYGGRVEGEGGGTPLNEMLVLSMPGFVWIDGPSISGGDEGGARISPMCNRVSEKYFVVNRGWRGDNVCFGQSQSGVALFDMSEGKWTSKFEPNDGAVYQVPEFIQKDIGGSAHGNATLNSPSNGWVNKKLAKLFETRLSTPNGSNSNGSNSNGGNSTSSSSPGPSNTLPVHINHQSTNSDPSSLPIILGPAIGGAILLSVCVWLVIWYRRRKSLVLQRPVEAPGRENEIWEFPGEGNQILEAGGILPELCGHGHATYPAEMPAEPDASGQKISTQLASSGFK